jgi:hypothetical protein
MIDCFVQGTLSPKRPSNARLTPIVLREIADADIHYGLAEAVRDKRAGVLDAAYAQHPERFVRKPPEPPQLPTSSWINPPDHPGEDTQ